MVTVKTSEYYKYYKANAFWWLTFINVIIVTVTGAAIWALWQYFNFDLLTATEIGLGVLFVLGLFFSALAVTIASRPLRIITQALAHVSSEAYQTMPPQETGKLYDKSGLKNVIQTIYDIATKPGIAGALGEENRAADALSNTVVHALPVGIIALNPDGQVIFANENAPVAETTSGQRQIELLFEQSNHLENWLIDCRANKLRDTRVWHRISNNVPGEEGRKIFDVIASYTKKGPGNVETVIATIDRTAEYTPEEESMDFIALAAHELRGPITVIRGYLEILSQELNSLLQPDQQILIDRLQVSAEQLSGYINNILNVSRYDRNHLTLHLHEEHLMDIIKNLVPDFALRAKTQNRKLTFYVSDQLPTIAADTSSLSEVINNLVDNAIKYSKEGGEVIISAQPNGNFIEVMVQDFGIGMPESVVGNLFSKFYRSHRSRQQVSGTGLGLYICRAIVESHGGTIWARSVEGQGSTFGFTIPIYSSVADKLSTGDNSNIQIIERSEGWIKNHAMFRR